jgi:hypothetical protein
MIQYGLRPEIQSKVFKTIPEGEPNTAEDTDSGIKDF